MKDILRELEGKEPASNDGQDDDIVEMLKSARINEDQNDMVERLKSGVITHSDGKFSINLDTPIEFVRSHKDYSVYADGADNIVNCVMDPSNNALSLAGQNLMALLAHLPTEEESKSLLQKEFDLTNKSEVEVERSEDLREELLEHHARMRKTEQRHSLLLNLEATVQDMLEARGVMEEIYVSRELMADISKLIQQTERAITVSTANRDAIEAELSKLREGSYSHASGAVRLLMSYHGSGDEAHSKIPIGDKIKIRDALQPMILGAFKTMESANGKSGTMERALFPRMRSLFKGTIELELREFMETDEARVLQLVYEMALDMQEIRAMKPVNPRQPVKQYNLYSDSVRTTNNPLMSEMHILNLITLAGYDPRRWAQSFGLRISGIAKQMLNGWGGGNSGPLRAEGIRRIFRVDTKPLDIRIDYTQLEFEFDLKKRLEMQMHKSDLKDRLETRGLRDKGRKGDQLPDLETEIKAPQQLTDDDVSD